MSVKNVKLNYLGTGKNMKMFSLAVSDDGEHYSNHVYYGDEEPDSNMTDTQNNNRYNLYNFTNGHLISNLYDAQKSKVKSQVMKYNKSQAKGNIDDYMNISLPDQTLSILNFTQNGDTVYALNVPTDRDFRIDMYDFDKKKIVQSDISKRTYLYRPVQQELSGQSLYQQSQYLFSQLSSTGSDQLSSLPVSCLYSIFRPYMDLSGIQYNYVSEIPQSKEYTYYDSNTVLANSFNTKNELNYHYDMNMDRASFAFGQSFDEDGQAMLSVDATGSGMYLQGTRDYFDITTCGDVTSLKYYDNNAYVGSMEGTLQDFVNYSDAEDVTKMRMTKLTGSGAKTYQKMETVTSVNRFSFVQHKSNMYSIEIRDSGINTANLKEEIRKNIKQDVENNIREMSKKLCPANTELMKVYWTGL